MTCYIVPATAAVIQHFTKKKATGRNKIYQKWLSHLLIGGSVFGVIDHLWHGELFLFGGNILMDFLLGVAITLGIFAVFGAMVVYDKYSSKHSNKTIA